MCCAKPATWRWRDSRQGAWFSRNVMSSQPPSASGPWIFESHSEAETLQLGGRLARALEPGLVVALVGHLGAGKTRLVKAVAAAAGVDPLTVTSPTFVLVNEYEGIWPIYHFDTYRLTSSAAFADLGVDEYFAGQGVCFVEWADRVSEILPADHLRIEVEASGEESRRFFVSAVGERGRRVIERLETPLENGSREAG